MTTTRVLWMVAMVGGISLTGGPALVAESLVVNFQGQANTGNQRAEGTLQQQEGYRVVSIVSGWGTATIDGQQVPFEPGTVLHIPNGAPFSIEAERGELAVKVEPMTTPEDLQAEDGLKASEGSGNTVTLTVNTAQNSDEDGTATPEDLQAEDGLKASEGSGNTVTLTVNTAQNSDEDGTASAGSLPPNNITR